MSDIEQRPETEQAAALRWFHAFLESSWNDYAAVPHLLSQHIVVQRILAGQEDVLAVVHTWHLLEKRIFFCLGV